jgi:hypothetical protein
MCLIPLFKAVLVCITSNFIIRVSNQPSITPQTLNSESLPKAIKSSSFLTFYIHAKEFFVQSFRFDNHLRTDD